MRAKLLLPILGLAVSGMIARFATEQSSAAQTARDLVGERWYQITLNEAQIGYLHSRSKRDWAGRWHFSTDLRFVLQAGQPVRIRQSLLFSALPPAELLEASQSNERGGQLIDRSALVRTDTGYVWQSGSNDKPPDSTPAGALTFNLADYLAVEIWLRNESPAKGMTATLPGLDFSRRERVPRRYRVLEHTDHHWQIENPAPHEATRITLDDRLRPTRMSLAGLFDLTLVDRERALAPRTALQTGSYHIPLDRPLGDHVRLRRLVLTVAGTIPAATLWPRLTDTDPGVIVLSTNTPSGLAETGDELLATDQHPVDSPRLRRLARAVTTGESSAAGQVAALNGFVHDFIRYADDAPPQSIRALLDNPVGNCNAYADLLTTLARTLGIPARTVFGLAYSDAPSPAFRFHAWNEVKINDRWQPVDPTWGQLETDATHLPMPLDVATALQLLTGGGQLRFRVQETGYRAG